MTLTSPLKLQGVGVTTHGQVLVKEALQGLCFANSHGEAGLSDTVLAILVRKSRDRNDVGSGLLGCWVTVDSEAEALG